MRHWASRVPKWGISNAAVAQLVAVAWLCAGPAAAQESLAVNNLVIAGGGSNTETTRYSGVVVGTGTQAMVIALSAAHPTLVIRGPSTFAAACNTAADCWDSSVCLGVGVGRSGACGWSGTELPPQCSNASSAVAKLDDCATVVAQSKYGPSAIDNMKTDRCVSAATDIAVLNPACSIPNFTSAYEKVVFDVLASSQGQLQASNYSVAVGDVRTHLQRIGDWYDAYRVLYPHSAGALADQHAWDETSRVLTNFWQIVYQRVGVPAAGQPLPSDPVMDNLFAQGLEADRAVLLAALQSPIPMKHAPFIMVLGDGLHSMSNRLDQVSVYQDVACRFRVNGCAKGAVITEVSRLFEFLSAMAHPSELKAALAEPAPRTPSVHLARWKDVFNELANCQDGGVYQQAVLEAIPGATAYDPGLIVPELPALPDAGVPAPPGVNVTPPLEEFARILLDARLRAASYQRVGLFDATPIGALNGGLQDERVANTITAVEAARGVLKNAAATFKEVRMSRATSVSQEMGNGANQQSVKDQIAQRQEERAQRRSELIDRQNTMEVEEARFGAFMMTYKAGAEIVKGDPATDVVREIGRLSVSARDATWPSFLQAPDPRDPLASLVVGVGAATDGDVAWPVTVKRGDIIHIAIGPGDKWAPSCAIASAQFTNPLTGKTDGFRIPSSPATGPGGYLFTLDSTSLVAISNSSVHSDDRYEQTRETPFGAGGKNCVSFSSSAGEGGSSAGHNFPPHFCETIDTGNRTSTTDGVSSSEEGRMSATFASGIRVAQTPFPLFPAGSLLLVKVRPNGRSRADIIDVQVLQQPSNAIVVPEDGDYYLAVNDSDCGAAADPSALSLVFTRSRPLDNTALAALGDAMARTASRIRDQEAGLVGQGAVGPELMGALRAQAYVDLETACGSGGPCSDPLRYYPQELLKVFDAQVSTALAILEAKVGARAAERELKLLALQEEALDRQLASLKAQAPLLTQIPLWLLKDLDTDLLEKATGDLARRLLAELFPIVDVRQPDTLPAIDHELLDVLLGWVPVSSSASQLANRLDWTGSLVDWSAAVGNTSGEVVARLNEKLGNTMTNDRLVFLGVPNPYAGANFPFGNWQQVTDARATDFWDAVRRGDSFASISIAPGDLYRRVAGATDVLACSDAEPVVTAMMIWMIRPNGTAKSFDGLAIPMAVDRVLGFPTVGFVKSYRQANDDLGTQDIAVRSLGSQGGEDEMRAVIKAMLSDGAVPRYRVANGLSPFTQFDLSLAGLRSTPSGGEAPADSATEMVVAFRLQTRNVANVGLAPMCK